MDNEYHIVLSHHASMTPRVSGAIALNIRNFLLHSATRDRTVIYGKQQDGVYPDIRFHGIQPSRFRLCKKATDFGRQVANIIPNRPGVYVQVHNRPHVFNILSKHLTKARVCLYLHNDPYIIKGLETAAQRSTVLSRAAAVICVSQYVRKQFLEGIDDQHKKVHVIHNGIIVQGMEPPSADAKKQIVFAGRFIPEKGALQLALALARVLPEHLDWSAVFIGGQRHAMSENISGYERQVMEAVASLQNQVRFLGHLSNTEVQDQFHDSRITVMPSICEEGFGRVPMEAMANGCAILSSERGGLKEVCDGTAIMINPEDETSIANALEKLISNPDMLDDLRLRSFESVSSRLDIRHLSRQLDNLRASIMRNSQ